LFDDIVGCVNMSYVWHRNWRLRCEMWHMELDSTEWSV